MNSPGSVHLTFTDSDVGCTLFVLWSGSHANVEEEGWPTDFELEDEVERCMTECACREREKGKGRNLFLPDEAFQEKEGAMG